LAIYGLLEARMSRADLVVCAGLVEGTWPATPALDPLLAPPLLRALGVPGADFRIGLSAHDLAGALGAPEVVLSHARRDDQGPTIPSRFLLRIRAMLGSAMLDRHIETDALSLARRIDDAPPAERYERPQPRPNAEQRRVSISATALDRLRGDPYQFYAREILRLPTLDPLDAEPSAAWKGTAVHKILETWHGDGATPGALSPLGARMLAEMSAHPFTKATWQPRLIRALEWIDAETQALARDGRRPVRWEERGEIEVDGVAVSGRADRIDRTADGRLAIVDYKTGKPPSNAQVEQGYALQLGVLGLIAARGGFEGVEGTPDGFEYWSLARSDKSDTGFGYRCEPILEGQKRTGIPRGEFLSQTEQFLRDALKRWILGDEPFAPPVSPPFPGYADYDQLMRFDEWRFRTASE
jgi:ATP-dependent helicase/nuclease subunit B